MRGAVAIVAAVCWGVAGGGCGEPSVCARLDAERGCVAQRNAAYSCAGGVYRETSCGVQSACVDGECRPRVCEPNEFRCDRTVAETCVDDGTRLQRIDCAASRAVCVVEPLTARCVEQLCTPYSTFCSPDESEVRKCGGDGRSYDVVLSCARAADVGARCLGARCLSRCDIAEAKEQSTRGCHFMGLPPGQSTFRLVVGNTEPDLTAEVSVRGCASAPATLTVPPGRAATLDCAVALPPGTGESTATFDVDSTTPVEVWAIASGAGVLLAPTHTLRSEHRLGWTVGGAQRLLVAARSNATIRVESAVAFDGGGGVPALPAGGAITRELGAGGVLALARTGAVRGVRVTANGPVVVALAAPAGPALVVPPWESLGRDWVVPASASATVTALEAMTLTTERDGTRILAADESVTVSGGQRLRSDARALVVAGGALVPPIDQLRTALLLPMGGDLVLFAEQAQQASVGARVLGLIAHAGASGASISAAVTAPGAIVSAPQRLGGRLLVDGVALPLGYKLELVP
jgi:hypothetical protein